MFVVMYGARERKAPEDESQVLAVLDMLRGKYGTSMVIVSAACDTGIGAFVKARCLRNKTDFRFVEMHQRIYADLPRSRMVQVFKARNAVLAELGDEFHVFPDPDHPATTDDLTRRVRGLAQLCPTCVSALETQAIQERAVYTYMPGIDVV